VGFDPNFSLGQSAPPIAGMVGLDALIDSGASHCCIDEAVALNLNLPLINQRQVSGVNGITLMNFYIAQIYVPSLRHVLYGEFAGVRLQTGAQRHFALMGRNFLQQFTMIYEGMTGAVSLTTP
jgi:hypothetical protein